MCRNILGRGGTRLTSHNWLNSANINSSTNINGQLAGLT